jgi:hypothetical protein
MHHDNLTELAALVGVDLPAAATPASVGPTRTPPDRDLLTAVVRSGRRWEHPGADEVAARLGADTIVAIALDVLQETEPVNWANVWDATIPEWVDVTPKVLDTVYARLDADGVASLLDRIPEHRQPFDAISRIHWALTRNNPRLAWLLYSSGTRTRVPADIPADLLFDMITRLDKSDTDYLGAHQDRPVFNNRVHVPVEVTERVIAERPDKLGVLAWTTVPPDRYWREIVDTCDRDDLELVTTGLLQAPRAWDPGLLTAIMRRAKDTNWITKHTRFQKVYLQTVTVDDDEMLGYLGRSRKLAFAWLRGHLPANPPSRHLCEVLEDPVKVKFAKRLAYRDAQPEEDTDVRLAWLLADLPEHYRTELPGLPTALLRIAGTEPERLNDGARAVAAMLLPAAKHTFGDDPRLWARFRANESVFLHGKHSFRSAAARLTGKDS